MTDRTPARRADDDAASALDPARFTATPVPSTVQSTYSSDRSHGTVLPGRLAGLAPATPGGASRTVRAGGWRTGQAERRHRGGHAQAEPGGPAGLVLCAISVREEERLDRTAEPEPPWKPSFPSPELVQHAADLIPHIKPETGDLGEGPRWEIVVSPGAFKVRTRNYSRAERTHERAVERHRKQIDVAASWDGEIPEPLPTRGTITGWTRRSRARLVERLSDLDYTKLYGRFNICSDCREEFDADLDRCPRCRSDHFKVEDRTGRLPAMLTLTYPGDWLAVAPSADVAMGHFHSLCKRYARAWGEPLRGPWKKEFQRRGAVHFHISTTPPMCMITVPDPETGQPTHVDFKRWLSIVWAEIVAHPDLEERRKHLLAGTGVDYAQGLKLTDPRRMAIYFAKYGAAATGKEYQHHVPPEWMDVHLACRNCGNEYGKSIERCPACRCPDAEALQRKSAGRFWGYRNLQRELAVREVTPAVAIAAGRVARRWYRAKGLTKTNHRLRVDRHTGRALYRPSRARKILFGTGRGFVCVNNGADFASQLASYLRLTHDQSHARHRPQASGSSEVDVHRASERHP
ncbi:hypothetical protein [Pseudonocardia sp. WMMC193]|uniref:hypothetical protein n=1 Tax=Pseudonocardia sp. WMMC193 TaxID=2911965 RepID=UPI001F2FF5B0|nr:hypothetical protein [Pseudonocardia sp. WMMC193]MCF7552261.1 hypothetical protein [Pseudonocardia sp. WMMC193]